MAASSIQRVIPSGVATRIAESVATAQRGYLTVSNDSGVDFRIDWGAGGSLLTSGKGHPLATGMGVTLQNELTTFPGSEEVWVYQNSGGDKVINVTEGI